jgi:hypothetical protein
VVTFIDKENVVILNNLICMIIVAFSFFGHAFNSVFGKG